MSVSELQRAEDFLATLQARVCERVEPWSGGQAYLDTKLHKVWDLNVLRLDVDTLAAAEIEAAADDVMGAAGSDHRRVWIPDAELGAALEEPFTALGWETDVHVIMGHRREPARVVDTSAVREVGAKAWPARAEQLQEIPGIDDEVTEQLRVLYDRLTEAATGRDFAMLEDGRVVSFALLFSDGETGQIEDVATLAAHRKKGLSRRVVTKALEVSRAEHDFTFLVADDRDWPKDFYAQLGFDVLGRHYFFLKRPQK